MTRYLIRQSLLSVVKLFVFLTLMFFLIQITMPGDFVDQYALVMNPTQREILRNQLGMDLPIEQRYLEWLRQVITLDLGTSLNGEPVIETFKKVIPPTLLVFFTGTAVAFLVGLWLGKRTAWRGTGFISRVTTLGGITLFTSFPPWLAWLVAYLFAGGVGFEVMGEVGGLRSPSFQGLTTEMWMSVETRPSVIAFRMVVALVISALAFLSINALLGRVLRRGLPWGVLALLIAGGTAGIWYAMGIETLAFDIMNVAWLAILTYTLLSFGETMLIMQSSMTEVLKEEYITTAKGKGLSNSVVREKHAARNAILPVLSRLVISLPYLITGVVIIENSLGWPGMGTSMWNALYWQNMPLVMNTLLIVGSLSLIARLFMDVLTAYLDPRIRFDRRHISAA